MKRALINIDYTYDFVADDGSLTCGKAAQEIEESIVGVTKQFVECGDYVVFAIDTHQRNDNYHPETSLFPAHNIKGTNGVELYGQLNAYYKEIKDVENVYYLSKTRYNAFLGTDLDVKLRERGIEEIHIVGVTSDICCLHTAIEAFNKGYKVVIHKDAVASFNHVGHEWALEHYEKVLGATIV
ncbi:isochorismatase family cysteine hydrolase [Bacillus spongiae]|uniref:Isochorismatase family cysteine hydrolase n=1 Tax=Bacillus spongiae TaxID=2683610 RepID=A0ABU8HFV7_9BACI